MSGIEIQNLTAEYTEQKQKFTALQDVTFSVESGEFISIVGASGCGKSTLLSILGGLRRQSGGTVQIDGEPVNGTGTDRAIVFQHDSLFPWMTVRKNVAFGIRQAKRDLPRAERLRLADEYLGHVGLSGCGDSFPFQLSGGMRQRAAIARALAMDPKLLLMDEPFSALDVKNRAALQKLLLELWEGDGQRKKTVVFVTHDIDEAILLSDRIVLLAPSPGHVVCELTVPFERPRRRLALKGQASYEVFRERLLNLLGGELEEEKEASGFPGGAKSAGRQGRRFGGGVDSRIRYVSERAAQEAG